MRVEDQQHSKYSDCEDSVCSLDTSGFTLLQRQELAAKTPEEIEKFRRERNRMHAKKTRLRKKKALAEMQKVA